MPPIIMSRPASMRLAIAISPSRDNSSTEPISRRYMRTGSSVRPMSSSSTLPRTSASPSSASASAGSSLSSLSMTLMPELGEHRHRVLDLLGGHLVRRQRGVQLVIGQIAALLAARDHLLDRRGNRCRGAAPPPLPHGFPPLPPRSRLARHSAIPWHCCRNTPDKAAPVTSKSAGQPVSRPKSAGATAALQSSSARSSGLSCVLKCHEAVPVASGEESARPVRSRRSANSTRFSSRRSIPTMWPSRAAPGPGPERRARKAACDSRRRTYRVHGRREARSAQGVAEAPARQAPPAGLRSVKSQSSAAPSSGSGKSNAATSSRHSSIRNGCSISRQSRISRCSRRGCARQGRRRTRRDRRDWAQRNGRARRPCAGARSWAATARTAGRAESGGIRFAPCGRR